MILWNSPDTAEVLGTILNLVGAVAVLIALVFTWRARTHPLNAYERFGIILSLIGAVAVLVALVLTWRASTLNKQEFAAVKEQAATPVLTLSTIETEKVDDGIALTIQFMPSKNVPLGPLVFTATISPESNEKILDLWPSGAYVSGNNSKRISADSKTVVLSYSLMSFGPPTVVLKVSGPTLVSLENNYGLQPVQLNIK